MNITQEQLDQDNTRTELLNDLVATTTVMDEIWRYHPDNPKKKDIVKEYFGLGFMMAPNTIFHNIFQVNPGEIVTVDSNGHITKDSFEDFDSENKVLIDEREKSFLEHFES